MYWPHNQFDCEIDAWGFANDVSDNDIEILRVSMIDQRVRARIAKAKRKKMLTLQGKKND